MAIRANSTRTSIRPLVARAPAPVHLQGGKTFPPFNLGAAIPDRQSPAAGHLPPTSARLQAPNQHLYTDQRDAAPCRPFIMPTVGILANADRLLAILDAGPIDPESLTHLSRQRQKRAQAGIDALIAALDAIEPDPDLEPTMAGFYMPWHVDECEPDVDDEPSGDEHEPSLGAPEHMMFYRGWGNDEACDQTFWSRGGLQDLEQVNEDGGDINDEPQEDDELEFCA